jgi:hypothetical protein
MNHRITRVVVEVATLDEGYSRSKNEKNTDRKRTRTLVFSAFRTRLRWTRPRRKASTTTKGAEDLAF